MNLRGLTYSQLARLIRAIRKEVKKRNPLWANMWDGEIWKAEHALTQIANGKRSSAGYDEYPETERKKRSTNALA